MASCTDESNNNDNNSNDLIMTKYLSSSDRQGSEWSLEKILLELWDRLRKEDMKGVQKRISNYQSLFSIFQVNNWTSIIDNPDSIEFLGMPPNHTPAPFILEVSSLSGPCYWFGHYSLYCTSLSLSLSLHHTEQFGLTLTSQQYSNATTTVHHTHMTTGVVCGSFRHW